MRFLLTMDLEKVTKLLATGIGDRGRLEHIKKTLEDGKPLYDSDKRYLQNLINENSENLTSIDTTLDESETVLNSDSINQINYCNNCGNKLSTNSNFCSKCGAAIAATTAGDKVKQESQINTTPPHQPKFQRGPEWKSMSTTTIFAVVLGLLGIQGVGHFYLGKIARGLVILLAPLILVTVGVSTLTTLTTALQYRYLDDSMFIVIAVFGFGIGSIIFYIVMFFWQIKDARKLCNHYNDYLEKYGKKPW